MRREAGMICGILVLMMATAGGIAQKSQPSSDSGPKAKGVEIVPVPPNRPDPDSYFDVNVWTDRQNYRIGEYLQISFRSTRNAYVYVYSTDSNGDTRQIFPNHFDRDNKVSANVTYRIPNRGYRFQVSPPAGRETITIAAIPRYRQAMRRYESFSERDPFPRSAGAQAAIKAIVPEGRPHYGYATDSTTIIVRRGWQDDDYGDGVLRINSSPDDAYVYLNGQYRGETPLELDDLRPGRYEVVIQKYGYVTVRRNVTISPNSPSRISVSLERSRNYEQYDNGGYDDSGWGYFQR